jgi:hypothetical protein
MLITIVVFCITAQSLKTAKNLLIIKSNIFFSAEFNSLSGWFPVGKIAG